MKYLQRSFMVPVQVDVSQEEWDRIFAKMPNCRCGKPFKPHPLYPGATACCGAYFCCGDEPPEVTEDE
jgi:hypothetical protein